MIRLNIILFLTLIVMALGTVTSQHKARKLYIELQQQNDGAKQYAVEYGQLKLEQSTSARHSRIEEIAAKKLQMQVPDSKRVQVVTAGIAVGGKGAAEKNGTVQEKDATEANAVVEESANVNTNEDVNASEIKSNGNDPSQPLIKSHPEQ